MSDQKYIDNSEITEELTIEAVKKRAVSSVIALTGNMAVLQIINRGGELLLTIYLGVAQYGVFYLVSSVVNFLAYFSDIGLAAALIQKKQKIEDKELKTTFTIQQIFVIILLLILFLLTPLLTKYYNLSEEGRFLLYAIGISFFLSSLKTIPSILLERELKFNRIIIPQIAEAITFNTIAVYLAYNGHGVRSYSIAVLARGVVGTTLMYILKPWMPSISFSLKSIKQLLKFGVPYQLNTFLAVLKDNGVTIVLGGILGPNIGLFGWAQRWAFAPLRFFMDQVIKVTFPAYSRMQDNKAELSRAVSRSILFICLLVFPSILGLLLVAPMLVQIIPKYDKWEPALLALGLFSINAAWAAVTTPLTNLLNAIGKIKTTFKLMIMWTSLTWLLMPILAIKYGVTGAAAASAIIGSSSAVAIYIVKKKVDFDLLNSVGKPIVATLAMGIAIYLIRPLVPLSMFYVLILMGVGLVVYSIASYLLIGPSLVQDGKKIINSFRKK